MNIKVVNTNGENITTTGEAGDVRLYIFDDNMYYLDELNVTSDEVVNEKQMNFKYQSEGSTVWVVAWSNLNGNQNMLPTSFSRNTRMQEALVQLKRNADKYAVNPDDLFHGILQVCSQCNNKDTIVIGRKTALMNISVVGIPNNPLKEDYYFVIKGAKQDAFNFNGNLTGDTITYRQTGIFSSQQTTLKAKAINAEPFRVYPLSEGNRFIIEIYNSQTLLGIADKDDQGRDIVPIMGKTINILLNFSGEAGSLEVKIKATDWNDLYQWVIW